MGLLDFLAIGIAVLVAFAIGAPQLLRLLFNRAKANVDVASRNVDEVPTTVAPWETKLITRKLNEKRVEAATRELMSELADVAKVD